MDELLLELPIISFPDILQLMPPLAAEILWLCSTPYVRIPKVPEGRKGLWIICLEFLSKILEVVHREWYYQ